MTFQAIDGSFVSFHLMSCPGRDFERDANARWLTEYLTWNGYSVTNHPDYAGNGVLWNYVRVLRGLQQSLLENRDFEWAISIQDDAQLRSGWKDELHIALANATHPVVYLDHNASKGETYRKRGVAFVEISRGGWGRLVAYHRSVISQVLMTAETLLEREGNPHARWDDVVPVVAGLVHDFRTCFTTRSFASSLDTRSLLGHPKQKPAISTLQSPAVPWASGYLRDGIKPNDDIQEAADYVRRQYV